FPSHDTADYHLKNIIVKNDTFRLFYSWFDQDHLCEKLEMATFTPAGYIQNESKVIGTSDGRSEDHAGNFLLFDKKEQRKFLSTCWQEENDSFFIHVNYYDYSGEQLRSSDYRLNNSGYVAEAWIKKDSTLFFLKRSKKGNRNVTWKAC